MHAAVFVVSSPVRHAAMAILRNSQNNHKMVAFKLMVNPILQNQYPIMLKCLNIVKKYRLNYISANTATQTHLGSSTITPSASVRNLGVIFDDQLTFKEHIAKTARSFRFALHYIRKIRSFLTEHAAQLLVQALVISTLDYCNSLLAGLPSNTIKPLQIIQNAAARAVAECSFNEPKRAHVTPLFVSLHWLPVAALIKFKTLRLAFRTTTGSAPAYFHSLLRIYIPSRNPAYFHSLLRIYIPSRSLRSASERHLMVASQRSSKSLSRTFSFTVPGWWNDPPLHLERWIPVNLQATTENASLSTLLDFILNLKKKKKKLFSLLKKTSSFSLFLSFPCKLVLI